MRIDFRSFIVISVISIGIGLVFDGTIIETLLSPIYLFSGLIMGIMVAIKVGLSISWEEAFYTACDMGINIISSVVEALIDYFRKE